MKKNSNYSHGRNKVHFLFLLMIFSTTIHAQKLGFFQYFNNKTVDFSVYRTSMFNLGSEEISKPDVFVKINLGDETRELFSKVKIEEIISALSNDETDWSINLYLYELYKKSATKFLVIKTREDWLNTSKSEDVEYWKIILKG